MTTPRQIGFLLYPNLTQLDMTGPAQVLGRMPGAKLHFVWKRMEPVSDDMGLAFAPTATLADAPQLDILCAPGGYGCAAMMEDAEVLDWLRAQDEGTEFTTSVCTGSLVLGAAVAAGRASLEHRLRHARAQPEPRPHRALLPPVVARRRRRVAAEVARARAQRAAGRPRGARPAIG